MTASSLPTPPAGDEDGDSFDLDAFIAEAADKPFTFTFDGQRYELPSDPDFFVITNFVNGNLLTAFRRLMGDEQFKRMDASAKPFGAKALTELFDRYMKFAGLSLGKSPASSRSSRGTGRSSNRTSAATTRSRSKR